MSKKLNRNGSNLSIIIQGAIDVSIIEEVVSSYFFLLPKSEIIISTWKETNLPNIKGVDVVLSDDPGSIDTSFHGGRKEDNFNRQIVSSINGIKSASRDFCLKVRSDILLKKKEFIDLYNNFNFQNEKAIIRDCGFFLINNQSSKDPYFIYPAPLHFCDWFILSSTNEMKKLFDIDLIEKNELIYGKGENIPNVYSKLSIPRIKWAVETYIWKEYLKKHLYFSMINTFDNNKEVLNIHDIFLKSHCIIADNKKIGIEIKKQMYTKYKDYKLYNEYSYKDWLYVSEKYKYLNLQKRLLYIEIIFMKIIKYIYYNIYKIFSPFYVSRIKFFFKK